MQLCIYPIYVTALFHGCGRGSVRMEWKRLKGVKDVCTIRI